MTSTYVLELLNSARVEAETRAELACACPLGLDCRTQLPCVMPPKGKRAAGGKKGDASAAAAKQTDEDLRIDQRVLEIDMKGARERRTLRQALRANSAVVCVV